MTNKIALTIVSSFLLYVLDRSDLKLLETGFGKYMMPLFPLVPYAHVVINTDLL